MSASLAATLSEFAASLSSIALSLFNAVLAVFYSIFNLAQNLVGNAVVLGNSLVKLTLGVFQGVFGFIAGMNPVHTALAREDLRILDLLANFIVILVLGGGYYLYTKKYPDGRKKRVKGK
jgi:hypothetical protein